MKSQVTGLTGKDSVEKERLKAKKKRAAEDEMVGWHHQLNGHEFEQTPGDSERQGNLECYRTWGRKEPDMTEHAHTHTHTHAKYRGKI